ncbi:MAG: hypothetical protein H5U40_06515, partial [Polyangiaceae bacterium]|nr:hypothetical protein [Polyangiaceae bacterium]
MRSLALALLTISVLSVTAKAEPITPEDIPPSLREFVPWVVAGEATYGCTRSGGSFACAWPGTLELSVEGNDVSFTFSVVLDRERL